MKIAIIGGTGKEGFGLALRWAAAREQVLIGSRDEERAAAAAARVRRMAGAEVNIEGKSNEDATAEADLVILSVPFAAQIPTLKSIRDRFKPGAFLVDVTVPLAAAVSDRATRLLGVWHGSAAEQAAAFAPEGIEVLSAFHNLSSESLHDLSSEVDCDVIVCGASKKGKEILKGLIEKIPGARYIDGGPLENSRIVESITALLISLNIRYKAKSVGIRITGLPGS